MMDIISLLVLAVGAEDGASSEKKRWISFLF